MKKGETRFKIRWGDFDHLKNSHYMICFQILSRGGFDLKLHLEPVDIVRNVLPFYRLSLSWYHLKTIEPKKIIIDGQSEIIRYYEIKATAESDFLKFEAAIIEAGKHWKHFQFQKKRIGDTITYD